MGAAGEFAHVFEMDSFESLPFCQGFDVATKQPGRLGFTLEEPCLEQQFESRAAE